MTDSRALDLWGEPLHTRTELRLHRQEPDYHRPLLEIPENEARVIRDKLQILYRESAEAWFSEVERIMQVHYAHKTPEMIDDEKSFHPEDRFTEKDIVVITYADQLQKPGVPPLAFLGQVLSLFLRGVANTIHLLPFFPYSSDRGFSVIDYRAVDPRLGSWEDLERLSLRFRLMFDGVVNHVSTESRWFREFLSGHPDYKDFFICFHSKEALSEDHLQLILRPRTGDILTPFETIRGTRYVWTTFSPDQVDLNYKDEKVLFRILDTLLYYVRRGADILRLDAATYLWWELGTSSAHLFQTHALIQLFRAVLDVVAPRVALVTETNVPHADNVSYFGNGTDEAHMVYNFALPPLVLHTFQAGNCAKLSGWASQLEKPSELCTYFNILDTHDGVGLLGARDILTEAEINNMVKTALEHGGLVSYRTDRTGSRSPYELNITWYDAVNPRHHEQATGLEVNRFIASRAVALVLAGVPGIYLPSLAGSQLVKKVDVSELDEPRSINRQIGDLNAFDKLSDSSSTAYRIIERFRALAEGRSSCSAFHPNGPQRIILGNDAVFTVVRQSPDRELTVVTLTNVTDRDQRVHVKQEQTGTRATVWRDLLSEKRIPSKRDHIEVTIGPYEVLWLQPAEAS